MNKGSLGSKPEKERLKYIEEKTMIENWIIDSLADFVKREKSSEFEQEIKVNEEYQKIVEKIPNLAFLRGGELHDFTKSTPSRFTNSDSESEDITKDLTELVGIVEDFVEKATLYGRIIITELHLPVPSNFFTNFFRFFFSIFNEIYRAVNSTKNYRWNRRGK